MNILAVILLALSANLDTFTVALSYGIKRVKLSFATSVLIASITTLGTFLSMYFGLYITQFLPINIASNIGSVLLLCLGVYMIIDYFKTNNQTSLSRGFSKNNPFDEEFVFPEEKITYSEILSDPIIADTDMSGDVSPKEGITLAFALTINNLGIGIAASITGISIFLNTIFTFLVTLICLNIGLYIGKNFLSSSFGKYAGLSSGVVITLLGLFELFI